MSKTASNFHRAVDACLDLKWRDGLQAIEKKDKRKIQPDDEHKLTGSVNIDKCLKKSLPDDKRWDYAVGYRGSNGKEKVYFVEVHSADTSRHVEKVLGKAISLREWAEQNKSASELWKMPREFHWVASGRVDMKHIPKDDRRLKQLAQDFGINRPEERLVLA